MSIISGLTKRLVYYVNPDQEHAITKQINMREFCKRHDIVLTLVERTELTDQLGYLSHIAEELDIELQSDNFTRDQPLPEYDLLLICGFEADERNELLKQLQEEEVARGALKAIATETNIHWTLEHILSDVAEEHIVIQAYMDLRETVRVGEIVTETTGLPPQARQAFDQRMDLAQKMLSSRQIPNEPDLMRQLARELKILITMGEEQD
ncbi:MAG: DUF3783 domain-containing protein [Fastidiosipilaceae bacterium]|jgi:hypothetical protein|nr:DUF3783 domain-containing protein [Clostridiaceae bacterium]